MRFEQNGVSVRPIPGTHTVLFGMDATPAAREGLLGFALGKRTGGTVRWLRGFKFFEETAPNPQPGDRRSTREHPIQAFQWGDYATQPGTAHEYVVQAVYGTPSNLDYGPRIEVPVQTANEEGGNHSVHFNRGAIPSQAFADRFENVGPSNAEAIDFENEKVKWLSRGLLEAALAFIARANGSRFEIRVAAYEFTYFPIAEALARAAGSGAQVRISYDGGDQRRDGSIVPSHISPANAALIETVGLDQSPQVSLHPRTLYSAIPHNKFMVLLEDGRPIAVWTGSTNFTVSGFLGQSNLAHVIEDRALGAQFNTYWEMLSGDPNTRAFKAFNTELFPDVSSLAQDGGIVPVFSPRRAGMLEWYAQALAAAESSAMFTAAFGVSRPLAEVFGEDRDFLRFILMERRDTRPDVQEMIGRDPDTQIALGGSLNRETIDLRLDGFRLDQWFKQEEHFRTQGHIFYIHTKLMGLDLLSDDPKIFTGSANFSDNSVENNDENMLLMRGPGFRKVADVYVNEFMRLFNHLYFRTVAIRNARLNRGEPARAAILRPDDSWTNAHYRDGTAKARKRLLFR